jgi:hypothetical protein
MYGTLSKSSILAEIIESPRNGQQQGLRPAVLASGLHPVTRHKVQAHCNIMAPCGSVHVNLKEFRTNVLVPIANGYLGHSTIAQYPQERTSLRKAWHS